MFRRIELIEDVREYYKKHPERLARLAYQSGRQIKDFKHGLCGLSMNEDSLKIIDAWCDIPLPKSSRHLNKNCRFYFTEKGWEKFGSKTIHACKEAKQRFHIITIKEKSVDVFYKDKYQVAVRARKKI